MRLPVPLTKFLLRCAVVGGYLPFANAKGVALLAAVLIGDTKAVERWATPSVFSPMNASLQERVVREALSNVVLSGGQQGPLKRPMGETANTLFAGVTTGGGQYHSEALVMDTLLLLQEDKHNELVQLLRTQRPAKGLINEVFAVLVKHTNAEYNNTPYPAWVVDQALDSWGDQLDGTHVLAQQTFNHGRIVRKVKSPETLLKRVVRHGSEKVIVRVVETMAFVDGAQCGGLVERTVSENTLAVLVHKGMSIEKMLQAGFANHTPSERAQARATLGEYNEHFSHTLAAFEERLANEAQRDVLAVEIAFAGEGTGVSVRRKL